ncbi:MAG: prolipoprotein diacylglyceryl transferase, partial [Spirochaetaceae bacterium]|nr:prolipoprotein diacylglyceryl transferase [Spirochaetaceae bacterium]
FGTAYFVFMKQVKQGALDTAEYKCSEDYVLSFFFCGILCLILGARIFYTLVYDKSGYYWHKPWRIFWPFDESGEFTGFAGMSYHGGVIGGLFGMLFWCTWKKKPIGKWVDTMAVSIPLGFTFGRLGNFFNAELYGRITAVPWGMVFPDADKYSLSLDWVQAIVAKTGLAVPDGASTVILPRHPSQLYEALFEGVALWAVLWLLRKKKPFDGFMGCAYTFLYGAIRFVIEYFREPDADLGYRIVAVQDAPIYFNVSLFNLSTGQILCLIMMAAGILSAVLCGIIDKRKKNRQSV